MKSFTAFVNDGAYEDKPGLEMRRWDHSCSHRML